MSPRGPGVHIRTDGMKKSKQGCISLFIYLNYFRNIGGNYLRSYNNLFLQRKIQWESKNNEKMTISDLQRYPEHSTLSDHSSFKFLKLFIFFCDFFARGNCPFIAYKKEREIIRIKYFRSKKSTISSSFYNGLRFQVYHSEWLLPFCMVGHLILTLQFLQTVQ